MCQGYRAHLRQMMLDELHRRNYSQSTVRSYIFAMEDFAILGATKPRFDLPQQGRDVLSREIAAHPGLVQIEDG